MNISLETTEYPTGLRIISDAGKFPFQTKFAGILILRAIAILYREIILDTPSLLIVHDTINRSSLPSGKTIDKNNIVYNLLQAHLLPKEIYWDIHMESNLFTLDTSRPEITLWQPPFELDQREKLTLIEIKLPCGKFFYIQSRSELRKLEIEILHSRYMTIWEFESLEEVVHQKLPKSCSLLN
jgi:hypothetical protein